MSSKVILHVSEVEVSPHSGMGRIEFYWKTAFEGLGFDFVHIGPREVGPILHKGLFAREAFKHFKRMRLKPHAIIVHEPSSGMFVNKGYSCFLESHGVERRYWEKQIKGQIPGEKVSAKTRALYPLWRLRNCDKGFKYANKLLLSNFDDAYYVEQTYSRRSGDIFVFNNGASLREVKEKRDDSIFTVLFNASWIERKGIYTLVNAAKILFGKGLNFTYLLIGTGATVEFVKNFWPDYLHDSLQVHPKFSQEEEFKYLERADCFVLPSHYEGQPLSLVEAMGAGLCCITTNVCGQKDLIKDGFNGYLFEVGDHIALANLMEEVYLDREAKESIGNNAKSSVHQRSWRNVSNEVASYILSNS